MLKIIRPTIHWPYELLAQFIDAIYTHEYTYTS
jgi:hypothetical protein